MKKINSKGFTLIELLAVIVIMGILMMVAIPSISRVIENSRKDTFVDIAKSYANAAKTLWTADGLNCTVSATDGTTSTAVSSATDDGDYYINIKTKEAANYPVLVDQGGKSSWGNRDVEGYVRVNISAVFTKDTNNDGTPDADPRRVTKYYVALTDGTHSVVDEGRESSDIARGNVYMSISAIPTGISRPAVVTQGTPNATGVGSTGSTCVEY